MKGVNKVKGDNKSDYENPWRVRKKVGEDEKGNPIYDGGYYPTKASAKRKARQIENELESGDYVIPSSKTLEEHFEEWLTHKRANCADSTVDNYQSRAEAHIYPRLGHHEISDISKRQLERFLDDKLENGRIGSDEPLSRNTVNKIYKLLNQAYGWVEDNRDIRNNPMEKISPYSQSDGEYVISTEDILRQYKPKKLNRLIDHFKENEKFGDFLLTKLRTGMRLSEIRGLGEEYVRLDEQIILVRQKLVGSTEADDVSDELKTSQSRRVIEINDKTVEILRNFQEKKEAWKQQKGDDWQENDLFFVTPNGAPIHPSNLRNRHFYPIFEEDDDLPRIRLHDLRHLHVTLMVMIGGNSKQDGFEIAKERVGHDMDDMTSTYTHILEGFQRQATNRIDQALSQAR